jgi:hypothetical protein
LITASLSERQQQMILDAGVAFCAAMTTYRPKTMLFRHPHHWLFQNLADAAFNPPEAGQ